MPLVITFEGLQSLLADLRKQGFDPAAIVVSEREKRDLKQEIKARCITHSKDSEAADFDLREIGFVGGVPVISSPDVPAGTARIIDRKRIHDRNGDHRVI